MCALAETGILLTEARARIDVLEAGLRRILGWRERDRESIGEVLLWIEESARTLLTPTAPTATAPLALRPEVAAFAEAMERKLRKHDAKRGSTGWRDGDPLYLRDLFDDAANDFDTAELKRRFDPSTDILDRAADVANFAMMIVDVHGGLGVPTAPARDGACAPDCRCSFDAVCGHCLDAAVRRSSPTPALPEDGEVGRG